MTKSSSPQPTPRDDHWGKWLGVVCVLLFVVASPIYLASGFYFVQPNERGVVRVFGRVVEPQVSPGIHYAWPWPVGRLDKPATTETRRVTVGLDPETRAAIAAGDMVAQSQSPLTDVFTGDTNIVKATMVAQYQISAADAYVTRTAAPDRLVALSVQSVMVEALGGYSIDEALTEGKTRIQSVTQEKAQAMLDAYGCGITLVAVDLESIEPPHAISDAFRDVASAKKDREKTIATAESFANDRLPRARGRAYEMLAEAEGYRQERTNQAEGEAQRFAAIHAEYVKAPDVTRKRLLLQTLTTIVAKAETYLYTPNIGGPPLRITID